MARYKFYIVLYCIVLQLWLLDKKTGAKNPRCFLFMCLCGK